MCANVLISAFNIAAMTGDGDTTSAGSGVIESVRIGQRSVRAKKETRSVFPVRRGPSRRTTAFSPAKSEKKTSSCERAMRCAWLLNGGGEGFMICNGAKGLAF